MKVNIPENISEVTLDQFQKYMNLIDSGIDEEQMRVRKIGIFANIPYKILRDVRATDFERIEAQIDKALETNHEFKNRFTLNGIEFGFIPELDQMSLGEFSDLEKYQSGVEELHKLMSILFRPITNSNGERYEIENYKGTSKYSEIMKQTPQSIVNGALVFFLNLANELEDYTLKYSSEEIARGVKLKRTSKTGAGIQRLKKWLPTIF